MSSAPRRMTVVNGINILQEMLLDTETISESINKMGERSGKGSEVFPRDRERRMTAEAADIAALMDGLTDSPLSCKDDIYDNQSIGSTLHPYQDKNRRQTVDPNDMMALLDDLQNEELIKTSYHQREDISESINFDFNSNIKPDSRRQTIDPEDMKMLLEDLQDDEAEANDSDFVHAFQNEDHLVKSERNDQNSHSTRSRTYSALKKYRQTVDATEMAKLLEDIEDSEKVVEEVRTLLPPGKNISLQGEMDDMEAAYDNLPLSLPANSILISVIENSSKAIEEEATSSGWGPFSSPSISQPSSSTSKSRKRKSRLGLASTDMTSPASTDRGHRKARRETFEGGTAVLDQLLLEECSDGSLRRALPPSNRPASRCSSSGSNGRGSCQSSPKNRRTTADPADIAAILFDIESEPQPQGVDNGRGGGRRRGSVEEKSHGMPTSDVLHFLPFPKTTPSSSSPSLGNKGSQQRMNNNHMRRSHSEVSMSMSIDSNISEISYSSLDASYHHHHHHHHEGDGHGNSNGNRRETVNSIDLANLMHDLENEEIGVGLVEGGGRGQLSSSSNSRDASRILEEESDNTSINTVDLVNIVRKTLEEVTGVTGGVTAGERRREGEEEEEDHDHNDQSFCECPENQSINTVMLMSEVEAYLSAEGCPISPNSKTLDSIEMLSTTDLCLDDLLLPTQTSFRDNVREVKSSLEENNNIDGQTASIALHKKGIATTTTGIAICPSPLPITTTTTTTTDMYITSTTNNINTNTNTNNIIIPIQGSILKSCLSSNRKSKKSLNISSDFYDNQHQQQQPQRSVIFGSPEAATYHIQSPTTSYTPIPRRQAKDMFPMLPLVLGVEEEEEPEDRITAENSSILEEWERLTSDSSHEPPFDYQEYFPETGVEKAITATRSSSPNLSASKKKRRRSMRRSSSRDFLSEDSLEILPLDDVVGNRKKADSSPRRKRSVSSGHHPSACELIASTAGLRRRGKAAAVILNTTSESSSCDVSGTIQLHDTLADMVAEEEEAMDEDRDGNGKSTIRNKVTPVCDVSNVNNINISNVSEDDHTHQLELDLNSLLHRIDIFPPPPPQNNNNNNGNNSNHSGGGLLESHGEDDELSGEDSLGRHIDISWKKTGGIPFLSNQFATNHTTAGSACDSDIDSDMSGSSGNGLTLNMILGDDGGGGGDGEGIVNASPERRLMPGGGEEVEGGMSSDSSPWCNLLLPSSQNSLGEISSLEEEGKEGKAAKGMISVDTWKRTAPVDDVSDSSFDLSMVTGGGGGDTVQLEGRLCDLVVMDDDEDYMMMMELSGSSSNEEPFLPQETLSEQQQQQHHHSQSLSHNDMSIASVTQELEGNLGELLTLAIATTTTSSTSLPLPLPLLPMKEMYENKSSDSIIIINIDRSHNNNKAVAVAAVSNDDILYGVSCPTQRERSSSLLRNNNNNNNNNNNTENSYISSYQDGNEEEEEESDEEDDQSFPSTSSSSSSLSTLQQPEIERDRLLGYMETVVEAADEEEADSESVLSERDIERTTVVVEEEAEAVSVVAAVDNDIVNSSSMICVNDPISSMTDEEEVNHYYYHHHQLQTEKNILPPLTLPPPRRLISSDDDDDGDTISEEANTRKEEMMAQHLHLLQLLPQPLDDREVEKGMNDSHSTVVSEISVVEVEEEGGALDSLHPPPKNLDEEIMQALMTLWPGLHSKTEAAAGRNATSTATKYEQLTRTHLYRAMQTVLVSTSVSTKEFLVQAIDKTIASSSLSTSPSPPPSECMMMMSSSQGYNNNNSNNNNNNNNLLRTSCSEETHHFIDAADTKVLQHSLSIINTKLASLRGRRIELQQQRIHLEKTTNTIITKEKQSEMKYEKLQLSKLSELKLRIEEARAAKLAKESQLWRVADEVNELLEKRKASLLLKNSTSSLWDLEKEKKAAQAKFQELITSTHSTYQETKLSLQLLNRLTSCRLRTYTCRLIEIDVMVSSSTKAVLQFHLAPSSSTTKPSSTTGTTGTPSSALVVREAICTESLNVVEEDDLVWGGVADRDTLLARTFLRDVLFSEGGGDMDGEDGRSRRRGGGILSVSKLRLIKHPSEIPHLLTKVDGYISAYRTLRVSLQTCSEYEWQHAGWQWDVSLKTDKDTVTTTTTRSSLPDASLNNVHTTNLKKSLVDVVTLFRVDGVREVQLPIPSLLNTIYYYYNYPMTPDIITRNLNKMMGGTLAGGRRQEKEEKKELSTKVYGGELSVVVALCDSLDHHQIINGA